MNRSKIITAIISTFAALAIMAPSPAAAHGETNQQYASAPTSAPIHLASRRERQAEGLLVIGVIAVIAVIAMSAIGSSMNSADQKRKAQRKRVTDSRLARGRKIAEDWYDGEVQRTRSNAPQPDPREYDPHNLGLAPPATPQPDLPDPPPMSDSDLLRYATFGACLPWIQGTAFAAVVNRNGTNRVSQAWIEACEAAGAGDYDEDGSFTPIATHHHIETSAEDVLGDVRIFVKPAGLHVNDASLNRVLPLFVRTARVGFATKFLREPSSGMYFTRLSMESRTEPNVQVQQSAVPRPQPAPATPTAAQVDPDDPWS